MPSFSAARHRSYLLTRVGLSFDDEEEDGPAMLMDGGIVYSNISRPIPGEDTWGMGTRRIQIYLYIQFYTNIHIHIYRYVYQ